MNYRKGILTFAFAVILFAGALVIDASAQTRGYVTVRRPVVRQVIVRDPWMYRYSPYWRSRYYYDPFYSDFYKSPYERYLEQRFYLERELQGNIRELNEHQRKYRADGYLSAKEREELADDVKDVQKARAKLSRLLRNY